MRIKLKRSDYVGYFIMTDVEGNFIMTDVEGNFIATVSDTIIDDDHDEILNRLIFGEEITFTLIETNEVIR